MVSISISQHATARWQNSCVTYRNEAIDDDSNHGRSGLYLRRAPALGVMSVVNVSAGVQTKL